MNNWIKKTLYPSLIYMGIITGLYILNGILVDVFNIIFSLYARISESVILYGGIIVAIYAYRKEYNNDLISYSRALGFGALTSFLAGIILAIYTNIYIQYINPDYVALLKQFMEEKYLNKGLDASIVEGMTERLDRMKSPAVVFLRMIPSTFIFGSIISLIASIFIKKEPAEPFAGVE